ncbi:MAG TPA: RsmB/NOP family class I SAM-dependent RNA methyltransferase [Rickettsiales bacterium]|nr:RsmB/NOP family class I SAM-dependent RNA methyltransferase [Rickettsiales bacterium]
MQEAARLSASIELLTQCESAWKSERPLPSDIIISRYFKERRFIGSKDRGAIAAFCYLVIRNFAALEWHAEQHNLSGMQALSIAALLLIQQKSLGELHLLFNGERFSPDKLYPKEAAFAKAIAGHALLHRDMPHHVRYNYPAWLEGTLQSSLGESWRDAITALNQEAPVDLRTNTLHVTRDDLLIALRKEGFKVEPTRLSPLGIRMQTRAPIFTSEYFKRGWFEMQDEGSQLVIQMLDAKPGQKVIDFCAGAGGKTLALAAMMQNKGRILAWDTSEKRLGQMAERLRRAKVDNVQTHVLASENDPFLKRHKATADAVVVDAPCSGSGTWRRNPDLKWRFRPQDLQELIDVQKRILESASRLVKQGGHLLYITCSFLEAENESQLETFLSQNKNFRVVTANNLCSKIIHRTIEDGIIRLTPHQDGTDGFFASLLQRLE